MRSWSVMNFEKPLASMEMATNISTTKGIMVNTSLMTTQHHITPKTLQIFVVDLADQHETHVFQQGTRLMEKPRQISCYLIANSTNKRSTRKSTPQLSVHGKFCEPLEIQKSPGTKQSAQHIYIQQYRTRQ